MGCSSTAANRRFRVMVVAADPSGLAGAEATRAAAAAMAVVMLGSCMMKGMNVMIMSKVYWYRTD